MQTESTRAVAAAKSGMDEKTARKYIKTCKLPSELKKDRTWRTRPDPFADIWEEVRKRLSANPGFEAKTLFDDLQDRFPGRFSDGQLRTLQRRVKQWRALEGPSKEIFFPQVHRPGELAQSDFTHMGELGITIAGQPFEHLLYHFVLTYSNWETGNICFSESFESLSEGLQDALWELGGVPQAHQTDRLTAAVHKELHPDEFTQRYQALLEHYGLAGRKTQAASPNEDGDIEQRNYRLKKAVHQALLLRGRTDFATRGDYQLFLKELFSRLNSGRREHFQEEQRHLINYRHMIDQLERKPGAFENYRYREEMFPGSYFRLAYDELKMRHPLSKAVKEYLKILRFAASESEAAVTAALAVLHGQQPITSDAVAALLPTLQPSIAVTSIDVAPVDLASYDRLLRSVEVSHAV